MRVQDIDHLDLVVADLEKTMRFYHEVLDLPIILEEDTKIVFQLGKQKLVCRTTADEGLAAIHSQVGSTTFSILTKDPLATVEKHLANYFIDIVAGPSKSVFANKNVISLYINDPAGNLIEIREYQK
ncbi:VOC family protein [Fructilactobacillus vespulae]|uniref:VOC family protein n=1 Tax=Fructilactobacillus vespulae TaxID=1249630 RepID=UPI0039B5CB1D